MACILGSAQDRMVVFFIAVLIFYFAAAYNCIAFSKLCPEFNFEEASRGEHNHSCRIIEQNYFEVTFELVDQCEYYPVQWTQEWRRQVDGSVVPCWSTIQTFSCNPAIMPNTVASIYHDLPETKCGEYRTSCVVFGFLDIVITFIGGCIACVWAGRHSWRISKRRALATSEDGVRMI